MPQPIPKYSVWKFITPYTQTYCIESGMSGGTTVGGMLHCLKTASRNFKIGDTVVSGVGGNTFSDADNPPTLNGMLYGGGANGGTGGIPLSVLNKVADNVDGSQLNTYINSGSQSNGNSSNNNSSPASKFVWTPTKKVIAVVLAIGAIFGILKLTKAI